MRLYSKLISFLIVLSFLASNAYATDILARRVAIEDSANNYSSTNVEDALAELKYVALAISTFAVSPSSAELGSTVTSAVLTWTYNKSGVTSQSLSNGIGAITPLTTRTYTHSGQTITTNTTYTLSASDGTTSPTANATISFINKRYWGSDDAVEITDEEIINNLSSELSNSKSQTRTIVCDGEYMYFAWIATAGAGTYTVNGLANTDFTETTRTFVNASGYSASFIIAKSNNLLTGTYTVTIS